MASELSRSIATRMLVAEAQGRFNQKYTSAMEMLRSEIDAELQEVRKVLDGLIVRRWKSNEPIQCWCDAIGDDEHRATCQRARALMEKLEVK